MLARCLGRFSTIHKYMRLFLVSLQPTDNYRLEPKTPAAAGDFDRGRQPMRRSREVFEDCCSGSVKIDFTEFMRVKDAIRNAR
ncbi:hypothetical protein WK28_05765 [Burkholderia vietnamiensis]|nr:hypothetical protein WK28_05765 [Burkholderia vietnamiensis]